METADVVRYYPGDLFLYGNTWLAFIIARHPNDKYTVMWRVLNGVKTAHVQFEIRDNETLYDASNLRLLSDGREHDT